MMAGLIDWLRGTISRRSRRLATVSSYAELAEKHPEVLADLARFCGAYSSTIVPGQPDLSAFNEGKRAVWLHILDMTKPSDAVITQLTRDLEADQTTYGDDT